MGASIFTGIPYIKILKTRFLSGKVFDMRPSAEITVAGKPIAVKAGEVVLLPAEKPHAVKATTRFKMVLTMIRS